MYALILTDYSGLVNYAYSAMNSKQKSFRTTDFD